MMRPDVAEFVRIQMANRDAGEGSSRGAGSLFAKVGQLRF